MNYRRSKTKGGTYFFTVVTYKRETILCSKENVELIRYAFKKVIKEHPFKIDAFVLLPDHIHCVWTLPENDNDFPMRWRLIKNYFTRGCSSRCKTGVSASRAKKKEQGVWQRRFWEHQIRNEEDYEAHVDYIHYNPVKHEYIKSPKDWEYSTFHRYVKRGIYGIDWGTDDINFNSQIGKE